METEISWYKHIYGLYRYLWHQLRRELWKQRFPGINISMDCIDIYGIH
jgi:hypothetical protein